MDGTERVGDDEVILRRIPPSRPGIATTKKRPEGGFRATSMTLSTEEEEQGLSCSRLAITAPKGLLNQLTTQGIDQTDWTVCRIFVRDVRAIGLDVVPRPVDTDLGHCEIVDGDQKPFPNAKKSKLALQTRILTDEEVEQINAGDVIDD